MKKIILILFLLIPINLFANQEKSSNTETIVFLRHAEKPSVEIGQINCKGFQRALRLKKL